MEKKYFLVLMIPFVYFLFFFIKNYYTPRISFIGGTEYSPGDDVRVFIQVLKDSGTPADNAVCWLDLYYPNKTKMFNKTLMIWVGENGLYHYDFIAPEVEGVYMLSIDCRYPSEKHVFYPNHVSTGTLSNLYYDDGLVISSSTLYIYFDYLNESYDNYAVFKIQPYEGEYVDIYINNTCTNSFDFFGRVEYNKPYFTKDLNLTCHNPPRFYLNSTRRFDIDLSNIVGYYNLTSTVYKLRGGGEVHISYKKAVITGNEIPNANIVS